MSIAEGDCGRLDADDGDGNEEIETQLIVRRIKFKANQLSCEKGEGGKESERRKGGRNRKGKKGSGKECVSSAMY